MSLHWLKAPERGTDYDMELILISQQSIPAKLILYTQQPPASFLQTTSLAKRAACLDLEVDRLASHH